MGYYDTAEGWDSTDRVPNGNMDTAEGLKYFDIHFFLFEPNERYGQVSSGYFEGLRDPADFRFKLYQQWYEVAEPSLIGWKGRQDGMIVVDASENERRRMHRYFLSQNHRIGYSNVREYVDYDFMDEGALKAAHIQSFPLYTPMSAATLKHVTGPEVFPYTQVRDARLLAWVETHTTRDLMTWTWQCAVYSWKHCRTEPPAHCDETTRSEISHRLTPVIRAWVDTAKRVRAMTDAKDRYHVADSTSRHGEDVTPTIEFGLEL